MLKQRILSTLKFFDLQDIPLTLLELQKFLLQDQEVIKGLLDEHWEIKQIPPGGISGKVSTGETLKCLEGECGMEVECLYGYYALKGRSEIVKKRLENYLYGIKREKLVRRFIHGARHLPFVRGIGLVGSQALGQQKPDSDIDLLILTAPGFLWLARILVTAYFQILGRRRHGRYTANRFCLNHYLISDKKLGFDRNLYTAAEYLKMRPLVYSKNLEQFQKMNHEWINKIFPQADYIHMQLDVKQSKIQRALEKLLNNGFGLYLERLSKNLQYRRLDFSESIVVSDEELSFHPNNRKQKLFSRFFESQKQDQGEAVELVEAVES